MSDDSMPQQWILKTMSDVNLNQGNLILSGLV